MNSIANQLKIDSHPRMKVYTNPLTRVKVSTLQSITSQNPSHPSAIKLARSLLVWQPTDYVFVYQVDLDAILQNRDIVIQEEVTPEDRLKITKVLGNPLPYGNTILEESE